jgi:hypothetical protein
MIKADQDLCNPIMTQGRGEKGAGIFFVIPSVVLAFWLGGVAMIENQPR